MELEADNAGITEILEQSKFTIWYMYMCMKVSC